MATPASAGRNIDVWVTSQVMQFHDGSVTPQPNDYTVRGFTSSADGSHGRLSAPSMRDPITSTMRLRSFLSEAQRRHLPVSRIGAMYCVYPEC